ncbi:MAG: substrate-binding domain-containing protein, partial [Paracoccus sp. (in: a-proteobacteria)]
AAIVPDTGENDRARLRRAAAMAAPQAAAIQTPEGWRVRTPYSTAQAKRACLDLLAAADRPTALLCGNDVIAQGALYAALKLGLSVPRDLSIIGIGDFVGSAELEPALTTIRIPARRIGAAAAEHLADSVDSEAGQPLARTRFDCELIMRATTAPPPPA